MFSKLVIAIDGPAGAGKSTVAKSVAHRLRLRYLDTGAMYRALALKAKRVGLTENDGDAIAALGTGTIIAFADGDPQVVLLDGEDITSLIRTPEIGELASAISTHSPVRRILVQQQRRLIEAGGVVLEGRDATTVLAPDADLKVFLTASLEERARRRWKELEAKGDPTTYAEILEQVETRDIRDTTRADSPLKVAEGAVVIVSDGLSADEVSDRIIELATVG